MIRGGHVLDPGGRAERQPGQRRTDDEAADDREAEGRRDGSEREAAGDGGANREPVNQQRTGVVEETLPFQNR
ncbi:MAG: hypothetical protein ABI211_02560, partial [Vicinamibacterales bacterium]